MKSRCKLVIYALLLGVCLIILTTLISSTTGLLLKLELIGLAIVSLLSFIGLINYANKLGEPLMGFVFVVYSLNLIALMYLGYNSMFGLICALFGLILAIQGSCNSCDKQNSCDDNSDNSQTIQQTTDHDNSIINPEESKPRSSTKKTNYSPGKYVASANGKYFHEPKSEWAKKILSENRVWFSSKQEAMDHGYTAHKEVS